jgi:hypothetical protein
MDLRGIDEWTDAENPIPRERRTSLLTGDASLGHTGDSSHIRRRVRLGRALWVHLAAWPWWPIVDSGQSVAGGLPRKWWELPRVEQTLALWKRLGADGSMVR